MSTKNWRKTYFEKRRWLNAAVTQRAAMSGHVRLNHQASDPTSKHSWRHTSKHDVEAELVLSDCSRTITLDFDVYGEGDSRARRIKVSTLRTFINEWCDAFEAALDAHDEKVEVKP